MHPHLRPLVRPLLLAALVVAFAAPAQAADAAGFRDFSWSAPSVNGPTAHKPQSKLWFNDGTWWGYMFERVSETWHIYRFDGAGQQWVDTGTAVDTRNSTWADVLWDGTKLYVASAGASSTSTGDSARLYRLSYNAATKSYALDAGFPSTIVSGGMEAIVLDKDATGALWATYTRGSRVYVNDSAPGGATWGTPFVIPVAGTTVSPDDISTIVHYNGRIGVMWSNQVDDMVYFASHADGAARTAWGSSEAALGGTKYADDHLNVRALEADSAGRVFAVVKTSLNDLAAPDPNAPQFVLVRLGLGGNWTPFTVSRVKDTQTRPMLIIDDQNRQLYVFATTSTNGATIDSGTADTAIYYKSSSLDSPNFAVGKGTPFIELPADKRINDVTASKQNVNGRTGLLVLASDNASKYYMHNTLTLGAAGAPVTPTVRLDAASDTGNSTTDGITADTTPAFSGTATAGTTVTAFDGATALGTTTATTAGAWSFQSGALAEGPHAITVRSANTAGSATSARLDIVIDATAPAPPAITAPADGSTTTSSVRVVGRAGPGQDVQVMDGTAAAATAAADAGGDWSANLVLASGTHSLTATTTDPAGNRSTASNTVRVTVSGSPAPGFAFTDGFESGGFGAWTSVLTGGDGTATVQQSIVRAGAWSARLTESGNAGSFARVRKSFGAAYTDVTVGLDIRIDAEGASTLVIPIVRVYDAASVRFFSLYRRNQNGDGVGVSHSGTSFNTSGSLPLGTWRHYDVRLITGAGGASTVTVRQDGVTIYSTTTASLAPGGSAMIQIGNENAAQAFTLEADAIQVTAG
jgi:type II secretory pathway pseudopilin PulG